MAGAQALARTVYCSDNTILSDFPSRRHAHQHEWSTLVAGAQALARTVYCSDNTILSTFRHVVTLINTSGVHSWQAHKLLPGQSTAATTPFFRLSVTSPRFPSALVAKAPQQSAANTQQQDDGISHKHRVLRTASQPRVRHGPSSHCVFGRRRGLRPKAFCASVGSGRTA